MYKYDNYDQTIVNERVNQFRDQTERFLAGKLSEEEFRPLRLMNGLYIQTHAPMLRVAIPYGLLSSEQLRKLAHISRKYDKNYAHFSTRQNLQYNWPILESVPDILAELATVEMHAIQTSGNDIRNTTSDQFAGIAVDELEDPRPYCEIIRQWSTLHPEFSYLPRKFKIAVSGASHDRAAVRVHDIGLYLVKNDEGVVGFNVFVGGGLGRTPFIGPSIKSFLAKEDLLSYLEAVLRVYNRFGRRDNMYKARIKILVNALGTEEFAKQVEEEWLHIKDGVMKLDQKEIDRVKAYFAPPDYDTNAADDTSFDAAKESNKAFSNWAGRNLFPHKVAGYSAVVISLKAPDIPPGDVTDEQMDHIADLADEYSYGEIVVTHDQNVVLCNVKQADLFSLWEKLAEKKLATPNIGLLTDMICCPGLDFCSLANAGSIPIAKQINDKFSDMDYLHDIGDIKIKMSGCMNACGHHHVGHIGILGVDKKGVEFYQLTLGGSAETDATLGDRLGKAVAKEEVADVIGKILDVYVEQRQEDEAFLETYRRVGITLFKERVYASN
ncbi:MAG TPA: nitrite/sulfite reductase [Thiotrichaceae bacterium]|jgi:sulfite reductase (NADPH) hemoprotein beta-component|nr:nitrite/sulfite reductase [Thiotrichaceae bacterium]HIM08821.1 nitrite/sulfite reductase [Gammaproteobacteria bacterium]